MKLCKECNELKPYDPHAKRQSKAQGFVGLVCWDCFVRTQRAKMQERATAKNPQDRTYGAMVRKAQRALDKLSTMPDSPNVDHQRKAFEYELERAQLKVARFGATAYDFTQAELKKATKKAKSDID